MKKGLTIWLVAAIVLTFIADLDNVGIAAFVFADNMAAYYFNSKFNRKIFG